ncbi:MAG: dTDP-4-dehydrorhamnose reductase [Patescibacteria group bacterium]|jgi:dTDP-4-dehydrorhamnose reductase
MKILVTGAKGQLGKKIIDLLSDKYELVLTDSAEMDITDKAKVLEVVGAEKPDFILHAAAYTQVDKAEETEEICRKVNSLGSENIAKAGKEFGSTVIYISTDYVFDGKKDSPYTEEDATNPLSVYGKTKLEGEEAVKNNCDKYYIIRSAWIFGELPEGHPGTNFVETMLRLAKDRDELSIVSDQIGSPTYTGDLVEAIEKIIEIKPAYGVYLFSGAGAASWYDFAVEIFKQTNTKIEVKPITSDQYPQKATRPAYSYMDKTKVETALSSKVRPWQEMLADYLKRR